MTIQLKAGYDAESVKGKNDAGCTYKQVHPALFLNNM